MKKATLILGILLITTFCVKAQSAVALYKPLSGEEKYHIEFAATEQAAKDKALKYMQNAGYPTNQTYIYMSTDKNGWWVIVSGKDQYNAVHYEVSLGNSTYQKAKQKAISAASWTLHDIDIVKSGDDEL